MLKKTISINPDFFKISNNDKKKKKKKSKKLQLNTIKPNDVKKELIRRIKEHKKKQKQNEEKENGQFNNFKEDFNSTMEYLDKVRKQERQKKTLKREKRKLKKMNRTLNNRTVNSNKNGQNNEKITIHEPKFGILKGGNKMLFSEFKKNNNINNIRNVYNKSPIDQAVLITNNQTTNTLQKEPFKEPTNLKSSLSNTPVFTQSMPAETNNASLMFDPFMSNTTLNPYESKNQKIELKNKINFNENLFKKSTARTRKKRFKRTRRKFTLGKYKNGKNRGKIGVLIKNNKIRKQVKDECRLLKKRPIKEVKEYLRKRNFIRVGCSAPENIIREMYENAFLFGDIYNKNKDMLFHNYMNE